MIEHIVETILPPIIACIELVGIFVVTVAAVKAFYGYLKGQLTHKELDIKFELANGLATGLEFKMAAEILKTVLVRDLNELLILGAIILLRALLSLLIHIEMKNSAHTYKIVKDAEESEPTAQP
ncbi:MAG TPA: DUF1622 domain-containing protein [Terriglobales bacterium]|nr:DUF1622 domain-containing protein [Terriglobales bacterium]